MKLNIVKTGTEMPPDYEMRLRGGAVILFGDNWMDSLDEMKRQGLLEHIFLLAAKRARELTLPPNTGMLWAVLYFVHPIPGLSGRAPTSEQVERWRTTLGSIPTSENEKELAPDKKTMSCDTNGSVTVVIEWRSHDAHVVDSGQIKRIAESMDQCYLQALRPDAGQKRLPGADWEHFQHPGYLFSLAYPTKWRKTPSSTAALSCRSPDGGTLLEVVCFHSNKARQEFKPNLVDIVADGAEKSLFEPGLRDGRVNLRRDLSHGASGKAVRVIISFTEKSWNVTSDYFVAGDSSHALYVCLKTLTSRYPSQLDDFQRVLGTLETPWLDEIGARAAREWRPQ